MRATINKVDAVHQLVIRVEGIIQETNARHVSEDRTAIILASFPMKELALAMMDKTEELNKIAEIKNREEKAKALEALIPGLKVEVAKDIFVRF